MSEAASKEPSMEDILASIRRIVSQDDGSDETPSPPPISTPAPPARTAGGAQASSSRPKPYGTPPRPSASSLASKSAADTGQFARFARQVAEEMRSAPSAPPSYRREETPQRREDAVAPRMGAATASSSAMARPAPRPSTPRPSSHSFSQPSMKPADPAPGRREEDRLSVTRPQAPRAPMPAATKPAAPNPTASRLAANRPLDPKPAEPKPAASPNASPSAASQTGGNDREVEAFRGALTSPGPESAVRSSLDRLKRGVNNDLDAKVEAVLRPMLREWLDDHLPSLVERLVRDEIERLAGKS